MNRLLAGESSGFGELTRKWVCVEYLANELPARLVGVDSADVRMRGAGIGNGAIWREGTCFAGVGGESDFASAASRVELSSWKIGIDAAEIWSRRRQRSTTASTRRKS